MKRITLWQAFDGKQFAKKRQCEKHEEICAEIIHAMADLPPRPTDTPFLNGKGFVAHEPKVAKMVRRSLLAITAKLTTNHRRIIEGLENDTIHPSFIYPVIEGLDIPTLDDAWGRFNCMSKDFMKEYGQPYFRDHENEVELD